MSARMPLLVLLLLVTILTNAQADPGSQWDIQDPPQLVLIGDMANGRGLEALYWEDPLSTRPTTLHCVSFSDFQNLDPMPVQFLASSSLVYMMDLDGNSYADIVVLEFNQDNTSVRIGAFEHAGATWQQRWLQTNTVSAGNTDLQLVTLSDGHSGTYLMATGLSAELLEVNSGLRVWSSTANGEGPGPDYHLMNWTLADFDGSSPSDELLFEFQHYLLGTIQLWMIDEVNIASSTPLHATAISMGPSRPNPMAESSTIRFELPSSTRVQLHIVDARGRRVTTLADRTMPAGAHILRWDGQDNTGRRVSKGVYFYELNAAGQKQTRKMTVVR